MGLNIGINMRLGGIATALSGFTPASLSPNVWYDPSDLSTLFQDTAGTTPVTAAGQSVARITDKSGNGLHLTQATGTKCPLYQVDGGGRPYLLFDGVDDYLSNAGAASGNNQSIVAAAVATATALATLYNVAVNANDRISLNACGSVSQPSVRYFNGTTTNGKGGPASATATVYTGEIEKTAPTIGFRMNAAVIGGASSVATGATVGTFLGSRDGAATFFAGSFYGLVQLARAFAGAERANLETYLGAKCGVTL